MKAFIKIFLGILLVVALLAAASVVLVIVFKDKIPIGVEVPKPEVYEAINRSQYIVATNGIEDARNATVIFESTGRELEQYGSELRYISGKIEPLVSVQDPTLTRDIPTDLSESASISSSDESWDEFMKALEALSAEGTEGTSDISEDK